jgi:hypothetical protein
LNRLWGAHDENESGADMKGRRSMALVASVPMLAE